MPIPHYGVLKARPIDRRLGAGQTPHYQIRAVAGTEHFRVAINVKSRQSPSELLYLVNERFEHPVTDFLAGIEEGFHELDRTPLSGALDFIRGNLFDPFKMVPLPHDVPGPDNDLNEKFDGLVQRALADETALIFAYGGPWGPEQQADRYFGFRPGRGIHEVHMNQGNSQQFRESDGVWNDGGLIFHFPEQQQWVAVFTAFQSQSWHTDDATGHALPKPPDQPGNGQGPNVPTPDRPPTEELPDGLLRIVGALGQRCGVTGTRICHDFEYEQPRDRPHRLETGRQAKAENAAERQAACGRNAPRRSAKADGALQPRRNHNAPGQPGAKSSRRFVH